MFVDEVKIKVSSGRGGDGSASFRREKYVPRGGPDGGDGGRGGHVILEVDSSLGTLRDFRYRRVFKAEAGQAGGGSGRTGRDAEDLIIRVPPGTLVRDAQDQIIADLVEPQARFTAARGGRGGRGNVHFTSATRQAPAFAEKGEPNQERELTLELKLLADVGLAGYPNAGKSTLLARVSAARPKIASYPFTTLEPNLGVVEINDDGFVVADIPGLIEGAHRGVGLGLDFLRHLERTRVIAYIIDAAGVEGRDPVGDLLHVRHELAMFSAKMVERQSIVVANKADLPEAADGTARLAAEAGKLGLEVYPVSAATGMGVEPLLQRLAYLVKNTPRPETPIVLADAHMLPASDIRDYQITRDGGVFVVTGERLERLVAMTALENEEALIRLQRTLRHIGLEEKLAAAGATGGSTVRIGAHEFELETDDDEGGE